MTHFSQEENISISRISSLVVINALVFQEVLSNDDSRVQPLRFMTQKGDVANSLIEHWSYILEKIDYYPIFDVSRSVLLSLSANQDVEHGLLTLIDIALKVVRQRTALRHDLMGRVYHMLLSEKETKSLATFYTSVPAATLLLKLALTPERWDILWNSQTHLENFKVGDLACGTGTLLMASAEVITDNYVRACSQKSQKPDFDHLQTLLVQNIIFGYDVLPSARHLTASTLALRSPMVRFELMNLWSLPYGEPGSRLGSIEFLLNRIIPIQNLAAETSSVERASGTQKASIESAYLPDLDLCVMNPPFTRSSHSNLLFGSMPKQERLKLQKRLAKLLKEQKVEASSTAGLGAVFVALGDRAIKNNGRIALVLPKALLSGGAWKQTRNLLSRKYTLENLIVSHDPDRWNFSENTNLSEVLLIAKKNLNDSDDADKTPMVNCLNLWKNPTNIFESLGIADSVSRNKAPNLGTDQGTLEIKIGNQKFGEAVNVPWNNLKANLWMPPCAFAQTDLCRIAYNLINGNLYLPGHNNTLNTVPLAPLSTLGELGPDIRDIYDAFTVTQTLTNYPSIWGHEASEINTLLQSPNSYLMPLVEARGGRHLRKASDLWPKAAKVMVATRLRMNTQHLSAVKMDCEALSNVWWPFKLNQPNEDAEKALVLWLNSTLGIILLLAHRQEVEGSWVAFQKPVLNVLPILDVKSLSLQSLHSLAETYDRLSLQKILPFTEMTKDMVRKEINDSLSIVLHIPDTNILAEMLVREPIMCLHSLAY